MESHLTTFCLAMVDPRRWLENRLYKRVYGIAYECSSRRFKVLVGVTKSCTCHGKWEALVDLDARKAVQIEQVEGFTDQILNSI